VVSGVGSIQQQTHRSVVGGDQDIDVAVVVDVAKGRTATDLGARERRSARGAGLVEPSASGIAEELIPHPVRRRLSALRLDDVDGAVGDEQVEPAVVVVIEPIGAESGRGRRGPGQPGADAPIVEGRLAVIHVEGKRLGDDIGDEQILVAVGVGVA